LLSKRLFIAGAASSLLIKRALAAPTSLYSSRTLGSDQAPAKVVELFSLSCDDCASFSRGSMLEIQEKLINTGKLQIIYQDFPLDDIAMLAAMVARYLPVDRYFDFISTLFANQDSWAFLPSTSQKKDGLLKYASFAGMDKSTFNTAINDAKLKKFIVDQQAANQKKYNVTFIPSFIYKNKLTGGVLSYEEFSKMIGDS
jgi:protein-disulfide isomerase